MIDEDKAQDVYNLVSDWCKKHNCFSADLVQDLVWDVWQQLVKSYDESKGQLSTYVFCCCESQFLMKRRKEKVRDNVLNTISLNLKISNSEDKDIELLEVIESDVVNPLENLLIEEKLKINNNLYNKCSKLLKEYLSGIKQEELALKYKVSQVTISRRIKKELERLRKEVKNETI